MFRGPSFIVSTMQEETTPILKRLWYDWTQQQPGIEPTNPLGQCWVPPIVPFYDQQGLLRTYSLPGGSIRRPHPGSPQGEYIIAQKKLRNQILAEQELETMTKMRKNNQRRRHKSENFWKITKRIPKTSKCSRCCSRRTRQQNQRKNAIERTHSQLLRTAHAFCKG